MKTFIFKYSLLFFATVAAHASQAMDISLAVEQPKTNNAALESYACTLSALHTIAQNYTNFLAQFGKADKGDIKFLMQTLFAPDCRKVVNGKTVSKSIRKLYKQIKKAKKGTGLWTVSVVAPFIAQNNTVVVHYEIPTEKQGTIVVLKRLICDNNGLIKEINEVFNINKKE